MKEFVNVALVGLGQIGNYFYNEINTKKKKLKSKLVNPFELLLFQQKIKIKKENLR